MKKLKNLITGAVLITIILVTLSTQITSMAADYGSAFNFVYGDLNGDEQVDSIDMALLRKYLLGMIDNFPHSYHSSAGMFSSDVNADSAVNSIDFAFFRQYLLGMIDKFPAQDKVIVTNNILQFAGAGVFTEYGEVYKINGELFINPATFNAHPVHWSVTSTFDYPPSIITISASGGPPRLTFYLGSNKIMVDDKEYTISTPPTEYNGSTLVPLKVIIDLNNGFNYNVMKTGGGGNVDEFSLESNSDCVIFIFPYI